MLVTCKFGHKDCVKLLVCRGPMAAKEYKGLYAQRCAVESGQLAVMRALLLVPGLDVDQKSKAPRHPGRRYTALDLCCRNMNRTKDWIGIARLLLSLGANPNLLPYVIIDGKIAMEELLIGHGADTAKFSFGRLPFHEAAFFGSVSRMKLLKGDFHIDVGSIDDREQAVTNASRAEPSLRAPVTKRIAGGHVGTRTCQPVDKNL